MAVPRTGLTTTMAAAAVAVPLSLGGLAPQAHAQTSRPPNPTGTSTSPRVFGPGCASLPAGGPGSVAVMARQRLVAAASGNPQLSALVAYINRAKIANLLDTANNITVFAPTNAAWKKLSSTQRTSLLTNPGQLKKVLNYHVVPQHITKAELPNGSFTTREGSKLTTSGSGTTFTVNKTSNIVCGNIPTRNATVYLVDTVLMPPG